ncbi:MAG: hypothetical protein ACE5DN_02835 [Flavobacteriales bacterium]
MKKINLVAFLALAGMTALNSCKKTEGVGGGATITGNMYYMTYDWNGKFIAKEEARDENVYIIYGDHSIYDDDVNTNYDGSYKFPYLRKGDYTVFAYQDCDTCDNGVQKVEITATISDKNETLALDDMELVKYLDPNDGSSVVEGHLYVMEYNGIGQLIDQYYVAEERVYIQYEGDSTYFDDMRTGQNGNFRFDKLIPGTYTVYAMSDCVNCPGGREVRSKEVNIAGKGELKTLDDIVIEYRY